MWTSIVLVTLAMLTSAPADEADFYVATDGADTNEGTVKAPFATLAAAQQAVRARIAAGLKEDVTVFLRGGTYRLSAPFHLTGPDSGTADHAITYAAYPGEEVLLSGGRPITGWTAGENNRWTVTLPEVAAGSWRFRQLFVDAWKYIFMKNESFWLHKSSSIAAGSSSRSIIVFRKVTALLPSTMR